MIKMSIARIKIYFNKYQIAIKILQKEKFKNIKIQNLKKTMNSFQTNQ